MTQQGFCNWGRPFPSSPTLRCCDPGAGTSSCLELPRPGPGLLPVPGSGRVSGLLTPALTFHSSSLPYGEIWQLLRKKFSATLHLVRYPLVSAAGAPQLPAKRWKDQDCCIDSLAPETSVAISVVKWEYHPCQSCLAQ